MRRGRSAIVLTLAAVSIQVPAAAASPATRLASLRRAVADLIATFGDRYPRGPAYLDRIRDLAGRAEGTDPAPRGALAHRIEALRREALTANPLLRSHPVVFAVRHQYRPDHGSMSTMFQTGEINTASFRGPGALKAIDFAAGGAVRTILEVPEGVIRDPEVHFDGERIIFSMRRSRDDDYHIYEIRADGAGLRQITFGQGVSDIDPAYLPDGRIVFASTREPKYCQCNRHIMQNLFVMDADGANIHQIGRNTLSELHPTLLPDGRIIYDRWEYVDKHFGPSFGLWTVHPDGTNHAVFYGNHAWAPGMIADARPVPGTPYVVATFGSIHDRPWGALAVVDRARGLDGTAPIVFAWPPDMRRFITNRRAYGTGREWGHPCAGQIDNFKGLAAKYEDPYPLSDRYFLCARTVRGERTGIYLLDVFGNEVLLHDEAPGCFDPMPLAPRIRPPAIPPRVDLAASEGRLYVLDVYRGHGMERVRRGAVKRIRIVEAPPKLYWTPTAWGIDATQAPAVNWNSTSNKRIIGDVPVEPDGSAYFTVPADRFVFFQLLDGDGMMIQSMRSGTMVRPGEVEGCAGCHESRLTAPPGRRLARALRRPPRRPAPWYGPPREFNYLTEVQPVLERHCVRCHDYGNPAGEVLNLAGDIGLVFNASYVELRRKSALRWFPDPPGARKLLVKAVDDGPAEILPPYAWGSHRSRLVDAIRGEHHGVRLDREALDRIVTWIDMNAPYYGSYASAYPDHPYGRSPLSAREVARLSALVGLRLDDKRTIIEGGEPVSFTRPENSPCLARLHGPEDPRYEETLAIIRTGRDRLARRPRMDMSGAQLVGIERERLRKYEASARAEARARLAIRQGEKVYERSGARASE